jgi:transcriptional regulator with XRE-family HTH domain
MKIQDRFDYAHSKIRELQEQKGVSQEQLAKDIGISSQSRVSKVLSDKNSDHFTIDQYLRIAEYFGVSPDFLFGYEKRLSVKKPPKTMRDIIETLFELENIDFDICQRNQQDIIGNEITGNWEAHNEIICYIEFNCDYLKDFLLEWKKVRDLTKDKPSVFLKVYDNWKEGILSNAERIGLDGNKIFDEQILFDEQFPFE